MADANKILQNQDLSYLANNCLRTRSLGSLILTSNQLGWWQNAGELKKGFGESIE